MAVNYKNDWYRITFIYEILYRVIGRDMFCKERSMQRRLAVFNI